MTRKLDFGSVGILKGLLLGFLFLFFFVRCQDKVEFKTGNEGKPIPAFELLLLDSITKLNTKSLYGGHPIVLLNFSPNCPYSKVQVKEIVDHISILKDLQIVAFSSRDISKTKQFSEEYGLTKCRNIIVGVDQMGFFGQYINFNGVPTMALFNQNLNLTKVFIGPANTNQILSAIQ